MKHYGFQGSWSGLMRDRARRLCWTCFPIAGLTSCVCRSDEGTFLLQSEDSSLKLTEHAANVCSLMGRKRDKQKGENKKRKSLNPEAVSAAPEPLSKAQSSHKVHLVSTDMSRQPVNTPR